MGETDVGSVMVREYFAYICPFLLITFAGFACVRFIGPYKGRRKKFLFMIPVVSALLTFLPIRGLSLAQYLLSFNPVYSIGTTVLLVMLLIEYVLGKELLSSRDMVWFALWNIGISLPLYASALGFIDADLYSHGYGFSVVFLMTAIMSALLFTARIRLSYIFISSLAAFDLKVLFSYNFFDYLTDGVLFVISLGILVNHGSTLLMSLLRERGTPNR
jgi:hypothetical protein